VVVGSFAVVVVMDCVGSPVEGHAAERQVKYASTKAALEKSIAAGEASAGTKQLAELEDAGEGVAAKLEIYTNSSSAAVEKIQIGLGVFAFLICGIGYLIFRRRKK
jgi:hypothetical protein